MGKSGDYGRKSPKSERSAFIGHVDPSKHRILAAGDVHLIFWVSALNGVDEWGSNDHCRLLIEVGAG